jgi:DUF4097 and DUF4098 domain-containing protein YvlB
VRHHLTAGAYVKIWSGGGTVEVEGWDRDSLVVSTRRISGNGRYFESIGDSLAKFGFYADAARGEQVVGDVRVRLPSSATLWIKVADADVQLRRLGGDVDVFSVAGPVEVEGSPRSLHVESMAGDVVLRLDSAGVVRVEGADGNVAVRGEPRDLEVSTVDGSIEVDVSETHRTELESIGGEIRYRGGLVRGGRLSVDSHSGQVKLLLPFGLEADFEVSTVRGRIDTDLGSAVAPDDAESSAPVRDLRFELGAGGAEVRVNTFSGIIRVTREGDGPADDPTPRPG